MLKALGRADGSVALGLFLLCESVCGGWFEEKHQSQSSCWRFEPNMHGIANVASWQS